MMNKSYFGIDFGTTNTAVVQLRVDEHGTITEYCSEDNMPFSSMLAISKSDETILFGRQVKAKRQQLSRDYHIFSSFKSKLGKDEVYEVGDKKYSATDITALFLKSIKNYVYMNMELDIVEATFAIPVDYTPMQRKELKKAAKAAGIRVNRFVSESTAAYMRNIDYVKGLSKVAVFDWGGGTLDISILEVEKNILTELAVHGKKLGGDDIDKLIAKKVHSDISAKANLVDYEDISDKDKDYIISETERAKIILSDEDFHRIQLIDYVNPGIVRVPLELERFKEIIKPQIDEAVATLYEAIKKAQISVAQLDAIIMVGGSCEMQPIQEIMAELFERKNIKIIYPEKMQWSVAVGAAMIETSNTNYKLSQSVGVILSDNSFFPLIDKDTTVPCELDEIRFGVIEETTDAHFIISDENLNTLKVVSIPIKGFTEEGICLNAHIDEDMIANITIQSTHMGKRNKNIEINKLGFYYDLSDIKRSNENAVKNDELDEPLSIISKRCSYSGCSELAVRGGYCMFHFKWEHADSK